MFDADLHKISFAGPDANPSGYIPSQENDFNVLVIDKDESTLDFLRKFLSNEHCNLVYASSYKEAVEIAKKIKISLVVSEFLLGDHSCLEIVMMLKKLKPTLPIAIMSGSEDLISEKDALNFSANYFIKKPLQPELLHNIIEKSAYNYTIT